MTLTWSKECVLTSKATRDADPDADPAVVAINNSTDVKFKITDTKLNVPGATWSTQDDNKLLEQLKTGFRRTVKWNKYRSEMSIQTKNNSVNYLIDPIFTKVNRLFVWSFENEDDRTSYFKYCIPSIEIKDFKVLVDAKSFFDIPTKNLKRAMKKLKWAEIMTIL